MGKISQGILGGFSGKVGSVIGGTWKGVKYMRGISDYKNTNPSQAQLAQQLKFGIATKFVNSMSALVEMSFDTYAIKKTGINSCLSYTLKNAMVGVYPAFSISYADVLMSRGDLPNALAPAIAMGAGSVLSFSWTDNSGVGIAQATDRAILVAYCPQLNQGIYTTAGAQRSALADSLNLASFAGLTVETYIGFAAENGRNIANSIYTGQVVVS